MFIHRFIPSHNINGGMTREQRTNGKIRQAIDLRSIVGESPTELSTKQGYSKLRAIPSPDFGIKIAV